MAYSTQWDDYRKRRKIFFLIFLSYLPGIYILGVPLERYLSSEIPLIVIATAWIIAFVVAGWHMNAWRCPSCQETFFRRRWVHNQFARRCVHCGLEKWADKR